MVFCYYYYLNKIWNKQKWKRFYESIKSGVLKLFVSQPFSKYFQNYVTLECYNYNDFKVKWPDKNLSVDFGDP
jgi:hypothetical protein